MYCVYMTEWLKWTEDCGLPRYYVGSSSVKNVMDGYKGSVSSREYKEFWTSTPREDFKVEILTTHETRDESFEEEYQYQIKHDVVKSPLWFNRSLCVRNGFFGRDVSGENNPMYGKSRVGETRRPGTGENISKGQKLFYQTERGQQEKERSRRRMTNNNPSTDPETMKKIKETWKKNKRNLGEKNGMFGKTSPMKGKKLYNNGIVVKSFMEGTQPEGWILGRIPK